MSNMAILFLIGILVIVVGLWGLYHCCDDLLDCHECKDCGEYFDEDRDNCKYCGSKNIVRF